MARKFLLIKVGSTIASLLDQGSDFEDWFIAGSGLTADEFEVCVLHLHEPLPELESIGGIIITGSAAYVTDLESWNYTGADYLRRAHAQQIPILGVCYGHQLIAWAFGGEVNFHPLGREIGSVSIARTLASRGDLLFEQLPQEFKVQVSHQQTVTRLPEDAVLLAQSDFESNQAFRLGGCCWGLQFHPEFSDEVMKAYIRERRDVIAEEGLNPDALLEQVVATPEAAGLIERFVQIAWDI